MKKEKNILKEKVNNLCQELENEFDLIPLERKEKLLSMSNYIQGKIDAKESPKLIVICTHNSRRSHIGQMWLSVARDYYHLPALQAFSGGTEATAFNIRAVKAFQKVGFDISTEDENETNPVYKVRWATKMPAYEAFSKKYETAPNPNEKFAAIMVCSQADEGCPFVLGCDFRLSLPYDDPKAFDDTELEASKYDERLRQIGREILFAVSQIKVE